jgi:cell division protein FtsQ
MHQRKGKKILIYFFLLLAVGSINNTSLNNLKLQEINYINVTGLGQYNNSILMEEIKNLNLGNIFSINKNKITNQINSNNLVEKYVVFKRYPSSIDVNIDKTKFLARINDGGKIFIVGSNGKLSKNQFLDDQLPFIFGKPEIDEFLSFKKKIDKSKISFDEIKNLYFFSSKRWDLELRNNVIIKLSRNQTKESLELASGFLYNSEFKNIKIIDGRVKNQIILND